MSTRKRGNLIKLHEIPEYDEPDNDSENSDG